MPDPPGLEADVIVVGSGPGGATLARELTRRGRRVLLLEGGADHRPHPWYGTYLGAVLYTDRASLLFTREGLNIVRPLMVGGATSMFCGCAAEPPAWLAERYGVDIGNEVAATVEELAIAPLPAEHLGRASTRLAEAARALGQDWQPQAKFMWSTRGSLDDCGARCMLGCRCGAKWNAAEFVDQSLAGGAELRTRARVRRVLVEDGHAVGVEGRLGHRPFTARAETVVLAAGGIGTPRILHASGLKGAGDGMTMDATVMVYGFGREDGTGLEPPMTWSWEDPEGGYMLSTLVDPWLLYPMMAALTGVRRALTWPRWRRLLGVMIKLKDEVSGGVFADGTISKPLTDVDRARLARAEEQARRILAGAGAEPDSIFTSPLRGTHPSGTVRLGTLLDRNLQTEIESLYVCDASVFPEALGRPTVLTIIGLARRLARHLAPSPPALAEVR